MATKIDQHKLFAVASLYALSNMGQTLGAPASYRSFKAGLKCSAILPVYVNDVCGHVMENDEHEDIFHGEAKGAVKVFKAFGAAVFNGPADQWPAHRDLGKLYEAAIAA